jgi:hypothetical protein
MQNKETTPPKWLNKIDHLVYAVPSLASGMMDIQERLGGTPVFGGRHPGMGTHNAILRIGPKMYLEIIAPDPKQNIAGPLWFGIDKLKSPKLVGWAYRTTALEAIIEEVLMLGLVAGPIISGSRILDDGRMLSWQFTDPRPLPLGGVAPFFIDWGDSPHPVEKLPETIQLHSLQATHPEPGKVQPVLDKIGVDMQVEEAPLPALHAIFKKGDKYIQL